MRYCTGKIVEWLLDHDAIESEDKELYEYALYRLWLLVIPLFLAIIVGLCFWGVKEGIVIVIPFMMLRKFSGGYHAKHLWMCLTGSTLLLSLCVWLSFYLKYDWKLADITAIAGIGLGYLSPIDHENKRLSNEEKRLYKKVTVILTGMSWGAALLFQILGQEMYAVCISIGIMMTAGLQWPVVLTRWLKILKMTKIE
mgnify:FL=1